MNVFVRKLAGAGKANEALHVIRSTFGTVPFDTQILNQAVDADLPDFEDALRADADTIVTRDASHFARSRIPVVSPATFLASTRRR